MEHPVLRFLAAVHDAVDRVGPVSSMGFASAGEKEAALVSAHCLVQRVRALELTLLASARDGEDVCAPAAYRNVAALLADRTHDERSGFARDERLGRALDRRWVVVGAAVWDGSVTVEQARVIVAALDDLAEHEGVTAEHLELAEAHLVELADRFDPPRLRALGKRIFEVIAPDEAERREGEALDDEERRAERRMWLRLRKRHDGCTRVEGVIPDAAGDRLKTFLDSFTSPRQDAKVGGYVPPGDDDVARLSTDRRRALGLCALLERLDGRVLPDHGGDATAVTVTISLEQLRADLAAAGIVGSDQRISAAEARRLACNAGIIPAVLGREGEVLDLGKTQRLFSPAQRRALRLRSDVCQAEGCTIPATWCDAHHLRPWSHGGPTDLDNAIMLCRFHHGRAHRNEYHHERQPDGQLRFSLRC